MMRTYTREQRGRWRLRGARTAVCACAAVLALGFGLAGAVQFVGQAPDSAGSQLAASIAGARDPLLRSLRAEAAEPGLAGRVIVIDPGHGGPDGGAQGVGGVLEKDITLPISLELAHLLRQAGATVYLTRTTDTDLATPEDRAAGRRHRSDLRGRLLFTRSKDPDAFVSIHCNAVPSPRWAGAQTIYMAGNEESKRLAEVIQDAFRSTLLPTDRDAGDMSTLFLLKRLECPAVIAEVGFISNPVEAAHLVQARYQRQVAFAVYCALLRYFGGPDAAHGALQRPSLSEVRV